MPKPDNLALVPDDVVIQEEEEEGVLDITDLENVDADEVLLITKIVDQVLAEDVAEVLDGEVTVEELDKLLADDNFDTLDSGVKKAIAIELSDESEEIKQEFEGQVNIFEGDFDDYVPDGSTVDVGTRRVVTAVTTIAVVAPAASRSSGGGGGGGPGGKGSSSSKRGGRK